MKSSHVASAVKIYVKMKQYAAFLVVILITVDVFENG